MPRNSANETFWIRFKNDFDLVYDYDMNKYVVLLIIMLVCITFTINHKVIDKDLLWLMVFSIGILLPFFGPQRHIYSNVIFLPIIALLIKSELSNKKSILNFEKDI